MCIHMYSPGHFSHQHPDIASSTTDTYVSLANAATCFVILCHLRLEQSLHIPGLISQPPPFELV